METRLNIGWLMLAAVATIKGEADGQQVRSPLVQQATPLVQPIFSQPSFTKVALQIEEEDGSILVRPGELVIRPHAKGTVLLCHGFKRDSTDTRVLRTLFKDYNTLIFDFRAHGWLRGEECCSFGKNEVRDIKGAVQYIKEHEQLKDLPLFGYGMSMGAATLILAQAEEAMFDGLILDSPFDAMENVINLGLERLTFSIGGYDMAKPVKKVLAWYAFNPNMNGTLKFMLKMVGMDATAIATCVQPVKPAEAMKKITTPCLVIGCEKDEQVPKDAFERVHAAAASKNKHLWISQGRGHVDSFFSQPEQYYDKISKFLDTTLSDLAQNPSTRLVYKSKR